MAICVEEVECWLPSEFLAQEEELLTMDKHVSDNTATEFKLNPSLSLFPTEFPYEFDSLPSSMYLSSPDESVVGSTEAESSDEDDFLAGLTRRLTQQLTAQPEKWAMAGSPESTLSGIGSWSVSSNGSPNGLLSPPTTPFGAKNDTRDLIYAAAGQVARLKMNNSSQGTNMYGNCQGRELFGPVKSQNPDMRALKNQNTSGFYSSQSLGHTVVQYPSQVRREQVLKPQECHSAWGRQQVKIGWQDQPPPQQNHHQLPHQHQHQSVLSHYMQQQQQIQSRGRSIVGCENGRCVRPLGLPQSAWPPLQVEANQQPKPQQRHSGTSASSTTTGMRAVFLGGSGIKKECAGTGVFLPRRYGNPPEPKKKLACSTVLLPAKVVQALNLKFEDMNMKGDALPRFNSSLASDYDALILRRNALLAQQKRNLRPECVLNHELRLPQEWTY